MLDGDSPSPSKRTIERRKHANNRRGRHTVTIDSSMHVIPSSDESETNKDTPTLKRSNSDPNLADSDDMLKRKQIAMTFPGLFHLKKGWLIKQGDGEQDWSKHWFVLCDNKLSYYKDSSDEDPNSLDGVIELAKCNEASETPVNRNYGFQIELDTGVIILAAMTSGIRNNWVGAINKAIKTAREDSAKKSSEPTSLLKENQPLVSRTNKPNSLPLSKSTSDVQPREEQSSPLQPARRSLNNVDLIPPSSRLTQTDSKSATQSPVELKPHLERRSTSPSQPTKTSPSEGLPPHSGKPEGRRSSVTKAPSSESRPRRGSVPKEGASSTGARRNSVTKDPGMSADGKQKSVTRDRSGSDLTKPKEKSKERRGRRGSRSEKRSQEDTAAAVTAALSKRTSNTDSKQSTTVRKSRSNSQPEEPVTPSSNSEQEISPRSRTDSNSKKQPATVDTTVMSLLEQEVDTLKAQLEQKQKDCARLQHQNVNLKAQLNSEQRDHKESFQDLENEQSGYMTQIEQMEKTNQKLQAELRQSKNATQQLQQQNQQLGSKFNAVELEAQGRDRELATLKARFEDIVRDLTVTRSNLKEERERSETLETELTDTWTKLRESGREGVDVDVIGRLSIKLDEARVRLEESESDAIEKEKKLEERFSLMQSQYHSENASLQGRLQAAMDETNKLQRRLTEKSEQVEKTEAAVQKAGQTDKPSSETNVGVAELEATVQKLKSELKAEVTAKSEVQRKYDDLVAQSAHQFLEGQGDMASTGSDDNAVRLETELDLAERELEKLKKHSASEKEKKILLEKAFQKEQALRKQLEERIGQSTQESGSSKVDIEQKNSEVASVRDELKKAKKEREAVNLVRKQLVTAVDSLNSQLAEKERKIETLSAEVETRGSQNSQLEQQLQASLSKGLNLQSRVENLEAELKQVSEKRETDASAQLGALQSEHRQLKRQIGTLEEQHALEMHNRQSELETAGDRINSLQDKVAELEIKLKTAMERAARIEDEAAASILDMQKEDELLRSKCERGEKEIKRLRGELHGAQDNYDELEFQFITQREDLKRMEHDRGKEIGQMGYRIQDLTNKLAAAERKVRDLRGVDHRNRAKGGVGAAGGMGMQLTQTRQMENKLKELESKLGDVESTLQDQDQDTTSLLGKIVSVEQQVQARAQLPSSSSVSSVDAEHQLQSQAVQPLSRGSSAASVPCDSVSTSGADLSEDSEPAESPDRAKQNFRARFLETKLSETELKLKEVTRKLVDVTTRELENRKAYQGKSVSESRLKEKLKVMEREVEAVTKELQQTRNNGDLVLQEKSHREILEEMRRSHNQEIKALEEEKETELEEERKATSISITALHKAHKHELEQQRADMQQNVSNDVEVVMKRHREVITKMDQEWKIISDKFTHVCANNATLKKQVETLEKGLVETRREMESWKAQVRLLVGQKAEDMAALKEQRGGGAGNDGEEEEGGQDDWGVDGNDNEKNPLQVLLRFREAELQCINNEINQLTAALEEAEKQRTKAIEQNVFLEGQHQSQEEHIKQLMLALEELQHQVEIVRTSGEGQAAQDQIQEMSGAEGSSSQHNPPQGSGDAKQDVKLRSWLPFLKRERSDSAGKGSRRRTGSDGTQTAAKLKKGASTTE
ncbi:protein outspread-like isoform X1 [Patiria miniata]|uniref:PH domain-containing protein n=1 Tax=Patiria miniata TaxID=46514 RepID=A0A914ALG6_PATMI|nr:protein outspread-like isoform X1 [Patiria miniata]